MRRLISLLLAVSIYDVHAPLGQSTSDAPECAARNAFPSAQKLCTETKYGDRYAIDLITQAACVDAYRHLNDKIVFKGWNVKRFACNTGPSEHAGNFVMWRKKDSSVPTDHNTVILAFKGTDSQNLFSVMMNCFNDLIKPTDGLLGAFFENNTEAKLHSGYQMMVESCEEELVSNLNNLFLSESDKLEMAKEMGDGSQGNVMQLYPKYNQLNETKFIITGHSMGGALATLFACSLFRLLEKENNNDKQISVITFGAPKCLNQAAANAVSNKLGDQLIRFAISNSRFQHFRFDIVSHLPFSNASEVEELIAELSIAENDLQASAIRKFGVRSSYVHVHDQVVELERHLTERQIVRYLLMIHSAELYRRNCCFKDGKSRLCVNNGYLGQVKEA